MNAKTNRALDTSEARLVELSRDPASLSNAELTDLVGQLRRRRERVQRMMRERGRSARRQGEALVDKGAREKREELVAAIDRVQKERESRNPANKASTATQNLRDAVKRKQAADGQKAESRTADTGPSETPNEKIAPSGAFHAEGHRPALGRSRGR